MAIGDNIKKYRIANKMTQTELANKLDKSLRTIQKYEANTITPPKKVIREISDIFSINMNKLTDMEDDILMEYVNQKLYKMSIDDILTLKNQQIYENELENKEYLYDKLEPKQLELLYLSKINDLEYIIDCKSKIIESLNILIKLQDKMQDKMIELLSNNENINDFLDKKAEIRASELLECKNEVKKILEGDSNGK